MADDPLTLIHDVTPGLESAEREHLTRALYLPLAARIEALIASPSPVVVSVSGLPGSGKSTLATVLAALLMARSRRVAAFSLDDLYFDSKTRAELGRAVHPLFAQRGPPGTHDVDRGLRLLRRLRDATPSDVTTLPRFDKLADEPLPAAMWPVFSGRPDVILTDGWFWGARPGDPAALGAPINRREAEEDPDGTWRRAVHRALGIGYPELFSASDFHVHLAVPSHEASVRFRIEQGRQERLARGLDPAGADPARIRRFLELFERVGRLPVRFERGLWVQLGETHRVEACEQRCGTIGSP